MTAERFTFFWHGPFSQWEPSSFVVGHLAFTNAEQYMMYSKAVLFGDRRRALNIINAETPIEMKAIGRAIEGFDHGVWQLFREGIVYAGNYAKFTQNPKICAALLATKGTLLVEASPHDKIWGIGLSEDDHRARNRSQWQGLNLLGQILTRVREGIAFELKHSNGP
jgi:ribA/ribD-fused uncharacterized protein